MKKILSSIILLSMLGCSQHEIIGNYKYKVKFSRNNTGDFHALINKNKLYLNNKNDTVFSKLIKSQKLDFERKNDTIFAYGNMEILHKNNTTYIITREININGYDIFNKTDSIIRVYEQFKNGNLILRKYSSYWEGKIKTEYTY
ncbi:MAG: hypothetical protein ACK4M1_03430 [Flavobacterium sp.]